MCGLPLGNGRTGLCNYSCTDPDSMVRHMRRVHLEAYNRTQGSLPGWIETEKLKKRKTTQAKRAESKHQAAEAERKSKCKAISQAKRRSKRKATPAPDVQVHIVFSSPPFIPLNFPFYFRFSAAILWSLSALSLLELRLPFLSCQVNAHSLHKQLGTNIAFRTGIKYVQL
jgi:hypothetical protein